MPSVLLRFRFLTIVCLLFLLHAPGATAQSDSPDGMWVDLSGVDLDTTAAKSADPGTFVRPTVFRPLWLDEALLDDVLQFAPMEDPGDRDRLATGGATIWLPMPDGTHIEFGFVESPIMEPELAAKFPEIKTYTAHSRDGSNLYARFDKTPKGFHAIVLGGRQAYIDPNTREGVYVSYFSDEYPRHKDAVGCNVESELRVDESKAGLAFHGDTTRTYRLAVACSGEYALYHDATSAETIGNALAAITTTMNRVTGIYEIELAIRFMLVANNTSILYWNAATDPFNPTGTINQMLAQSQTTINNIIGAANYDIGHTFAVADLGGIGELQCVCKDNSKARGVTTSLAPIGDPFDVDFVAHEIGHQFGCEHTFNSTKGSCKGNRAKERAFERGSGVSIMSYAGLCGVDDITSHSAPIFHSESLRQIQEFLATISCAVSVSTGNTGPIVDAGADYTVPKQTPFILTATGDDAEADAITYAWEERDLGPAQKIDDPDNGRSPLFRTYTTKLDSWRIFPRLEFILDGKQYANRFEFLPTKGRTMTFWVIGRDGRGGFGSDEARITVDGNSGPFKVKYPNTPVVIKGGSKKKVKWDVAKTNMAPVSTPNVKILLSTDGGLSFPTVLKASTPNDGEEKVKFPKTGTLTGRVKIEGVNSIFFDISDTNFAIDGGFSFVGAWHMEAQFGTHFVLHLTLRDDGTSRLCADPDGIDSCSEGIWSVEEDGTSGAVSLFPTHDYNYEIIDNNTVNLHNKNSGTLEYVMTRL
ncbi:MAG: hypothetical protein HUU46_23370 [Candidatus Hydrogenedentes bacterium]|nr:hypothetical protein [Candidatus Hydrogenedentota bacterium]